MPEGDCSLYDGGGRLDQVAGGRGAGGACAHFRFGHETERRQPQVQVHRCSSGDGIPASVGWQEQQGREPSPQTERVYRGDDHRDLLNRTDYRLPQRVKTSFVCMSYDWTKYPAMGAVGQAPHHTGPGFPVSDPSSTLKFAYSHSYHANILFLRSRNN